MTTRDRLYKIAGTPGSDDVNSSPTVMGIRGDTENVIVQGFVLDGETAGALAAPSHERGIMLPRSILLAAAREMTEGA
jgi:hypothetical protein